jgi:hypothetical protein
MEERRNRIESIEPIGFPDITPQLARESGFLGLIDLLKVAKHSANLAQPRRTFQAAAPLAFTDADCDFKPYCSKQRAIPTDRRPARHAAAMATTYFQTQNGRLQTASGCLNGLRWFDDAKRHRQRRVRLC